MSDTPATDPVADLNGYPTARGWRLIASRLAKSMPSKTRRGRGGMQFSYIDARQVMDRLDDVVGPGNWSDSYVPRAGRTDEVVVECTLTIFGVSKTDVGYSNNPDADEFIEALDASGHRVVDPETGEVKMKRNPAYEDEPLKAAYSDAFKRAAVKWSIGRFLYR